MKQSERSFMPVISEAVPFNDFIHSSVLQNRYIAWCETGKEDLWQTAYPVGQPAIMLIGPEGDFSPKEINLAKENNFLPVSLGQARLRTETAAMYVAASFTFLNETGSPYIPSL
jgi:16S rRNA (uracil1498-N3)-methyltransferase